MTRTDTGKTAAKEISKVLAFTPEELDELIAKTRADALAEPIPDPKPAIEEGPHLEDEHLRFLKREEMKAAGYTGDEEFLTDDMRKILAESDGD